jgi:parvulin-like peptidyl-prolyl isomerase
MALYVNGEKVDEKAIQKEAERLRGPYERLMEDKTEEERNTQLYNWSRENVIEQVLLKQAALKNPEKIPSEIVEQEYQELVRRSRGEEKLFENLGLTSDPEARVKRDIILGLRVDRFMGKVVQSVPTPLEEEVKAFYEANQDKFMVPEMVSAIHLVAHRSSDRDEDEIRREFEGILAEMREEGSFDDVAKRRAAEGARVVKLGYFPRGRIMKELEDALFALEDGQVSDVIETPHSFHIAKLTGKKAPAPRPFDHVRSDIEKKLFERTRDKALEDFIDAERRKAVLEEK